MRRTIRGTDGATIPAAIYGEFSAIAQQDWLESHGVPLCHSGDLARYAAGVPATYNHVSEYLPAVEAFLGAYEEDENEED